MSSRSNELSTKVGHFGHQNALLAGANLSKCSESHLENEEDEDEEEDVDFNPFLKETLSLEASSSLSSEIEGLDADVVDSGGNTCAALVASFSSKPPGQVQGYAVGDSEHGEEIVFQTTVSSGGACEKESEITSSPRLKKRKSVLISEPENETFCEKENGLGTDAVKDMLGEFSNTSHSRKPIVDIDDEDAICMRTRARYSLASFTLDELETFLQETDDDDDLQNVDDEEEYRKFLAAVLQGGDGDTKIQVKENVDDEDEDNDADFEIEIEEALESDIDENTRGENQEEVYKAAGQRPQTRQNRRQKSSVRHNKELLEQASRPLRPLLPNVPIAPFPALDRKCLMPETASHTLSLSAHDGFINGFTQHQLGQLYCLIHEHVQLLIQVFSLCVLEPSRQHVASQVQELISEMLRKHDQALSWRRVPYPYFCFCPPYIHPSVQDELFKPLTAQCTVESSCSLDAQRECSSGNNKVLPSDVISPSKGRCKYVSNGREGQFQTIEGSFWIPFLTGPILSVLDVAPLNLAGRYMDDVSTAVQEYQRRHVEATFDARFEREPLFPLHNFQSFAEANGEVSRGTTPPAANMVPSSPASDQPSKKTLAAALVERTKKQSVALVTKEISKLAQRFFPLFNPALFPHKPPPAPVANRVLFTDTEDELLAMGLMEYNTDWKAIQQRFLPCKSKHQIFVRQKNRSSSKAPENPIKAVRRMKNSPLTAEEIARIQEGLKVFKLDWMSVWKFVAPHRDPSLLPRQWRIATGTQKSYKLTADKKEKRRLYESNRRKCKPATLASWQTSSDKEDCHTDNAGAENNNEDDCMDNEEAAYVHEAFLADWRPGTSCLVSSKLPILDPREENAPSDVLSREGSRVCEQMNNSGSGESQPQVGHEFPAALKYSQNLHTLTHSTHAKHYPASIELDHLVSDMNLRSSQSQFCLRPYRAHRANSACLVKLAPDLPPVNLPPSVRVMPQSAFKSYQGGSSTKVSAADAGTGCAATKNMVLTPPHVAKAGTGHPIKAKENESNPLKHGITKLHPQESGVIRDKCAAVEKGESDLQMHPLLFQAPEDGRLPYYPLNCSNSVCSSFNFFSGNQPQSNLSLFHNPHQANYAANFFHKSSKSKETTSSSCGIDFHPLLQKANDINNDLVTANSAAQLSVNLELLRGKCAQLQNPSDVIPIESRVNNSSTATCTKSSCPNGKANDLDLEIHLSFTSRKENSMEGGAVTEHNPTRSCLSALDFGTIDETQNDKSSCYQRSEYCPTASIPEVVSNKLDSGAHASVISSNNVNRYEVNNVGDQSLREIVMEQEELSDSEEEVGEQVEFECEEMADSEGEEGSDSEQVADIQNKEVPHVTREKVVTDADFDDQRCEARNHSNSQGNACDPSEANTLNLGLTDQGKDMLSSCFSSSLNSCASSCPPHNKTKPKREESRNAEGSAGRSWAPSCTNGSCKKTRTNHIPSQKHAVDTQQLELDSLAVTPLRKPRKGQCRTNSSLITDRAKKRDSSLNAGATVEHSNRVSNSEFG
uniref:Myb-like domain-containing protein n=1 Tax=Davidia involucrata TaxID=16924 RepID=A0A5B7AHS1_DAVIN